MEDIEKKFTKPDDAVRYYKKLASEYKQRLEETQQELQEFQEGSRDLETELETQLVQSENKVKDLQSTNSQLKQENERLQVKLNEHQSDMSHMITILQEELAQVKLCKDDLQQYVRKLEQKNDDLERAMRASVSSLEDFEGRLNQAIERNAFLENELDEKENMAVLIQRLKDETRDLKQELTVHDIPRNSEVPKSLEKLTDTNRIEIDASSPRYRLKKSLTHTNGMTPPVPTVTYSALNIVGDLLKKVGVLESKLQSCRNSIKDSSDNIAEKRTTNKLTPPNHARHINGSSLSTPKDCIPLTA